MKRRLGQREYYVLPSPLPRAWLAARLLPAPVCACMHARSRALQRELRPGPHCVWRSSGESYVVLSAARCCDGERWKEEEEEEEEEKEKAERQAVSKGVA